MSAKIGYDNLFSKGALVENGANPAESGYPIQHAVDWQGFTTYRSSNFTIESWVQVDLASSMPADYIGLAYFEPGNRPGGIDQVIDVETSLTGGDPWVTVHSFNIVSANSTDLSGCAVIFETFNSVSSQHWRVRHQNGDFSMGVMAVGARLDLPVVGSLPFMPPMFGNRDRNVMNISEEGKTLGESAFNKGSQFDLNLDLLKPAFLRTDWDKVKAHALELPFFYQWNSEIRPDENVLIWAKSPMDLKPKHNQPLFLNLNVPCDAYWRQAYRN